jgi:site-specific DNA-methyltransferase (adenine-specific)
MAVEREAAPVNIETVPIDSLHFDPSNVRKHDAKNIDAIKASIARFGQQKPIVIDADGVVRAGNGTLSAMRALSFKEIDVVRTPLRGSEATAYAIADNRTAELAEWDDDALAQTLAALQIEDEDLAIATGFDASEIDRLTAPDEVIEDEVPEPPVVAITKRGDIWILGSHRVMCGDSTSADDVARLMRGEKIDLCFTSPPYNSKDGGYKTDYKSKTKKFYNHECDDRTEDEWVEFCNAVLLLIASHLSSDDSSVVWNVMYTANCRSGYGRTMFAGSHGLSVKETICWDKGAGFPTASKGILSRNWELIFVLSIGKKYTTTQTENEPRWAKWDIARPKHQHEEHKATFPVELASRAMSDFGLKEDKVYDPFLGSGTTLIAAEQLNRKCYGMEISPQYCDVIVARWEKLTGKKAQLDETS